MLIVMIYLDMAGWEIIYSSANYINKNSNINAVSVKIHFWQYEVNRSIVKQSSQPVSTVSSWICTSGKIYNLENWVYWFNLFQLLLTVFKMFFIFNSHNIKTTWIFSFDILGIYFTVISKIPETYLFIVKCAC